MRLRLSQHDRHPFARSVVSARGHQHCGVELARLAALLDERCEADVVVPGERAGEKVSLRMRDSTLADVIEAAGLTIRDSEPPATTY